MLRSGQSLGLAQVGLGEEEPAHIPGAALLLVHKTIGIEARIRVGVQPDTYTLCDEITSEMLLISAQPAVP